MKHHIYVLLTITAGLIVGCKKEEPALNPDLTAGLTGVYPLTSYTQGTQTVNLPSNGNSGLFTMTRIDDTHLSAKLTLTELGKTYDASTNTFTLARDAGDASLYNITVMGTTAGNMTASKVYVFARSADGTLTTINAAR